MPDRQNELRSTHPTLNAAGFCALLLACGLFMMGSTDRATGNADQVPATTGREYTLGPRDKVRIKVFAWRPARDEVYEWKALNDVFSVGPSGQLSIPLIGDVRAGGLSLNEVAIAIGAQLQATLGLIEAPRATLEIVEFRPFYILGMVAKPGEYAYRPDLTIVQAVSLAGGHERLNEYESVQLDRATISTYGERSVIQSEMASLLARRARLDAEINGGQSVRFPPSLVHLDREAAIAVADEERIFAARTTAFEARRGRLASTRVMLEEQLQALQTHASEQERHVAAAQADLKRFDDLIERKLTTTTRRAEAARNLMQAEGDAMRMLAQVSDVRRELSRIDMELQGLHDDRVNQAVVDMRSTQARLDELERRTRTADTLMRQADSAGVQLSAYDDGVRKAQSTYMIVRKVGDAFQELAATETTTLQPGDTLKVEAPAPTPSAGPQRALDRAPAAAQSPITTLTYDLNPHAAAPLR